MATKPLVTNPVADLPENWTNNQIVAPSGTSVGLTQQHGYNYLMEKVNEALEDLGDVNDAFPDLLAQENESTVKTLSGDVVSFPDGVADLPVKSFVGSIIPQQDLHGYSNPWPAGGGANKWDEEWEVGSISNTTGQNTVNANNIRSVNYIPVTAGAEYYAVSPQTLGLRYYDASKNFLSAASVLNNTFTVPTGAAFLRFLMLATSTYANNIAINYPSSITTYSPYGNICPISGWTGAEIYRTGINVWDEAWELGTISSITGANVSGTSNIRSTNYIPVKPNTTYYYRNGAAKKANLRFYDINQSFIGAPSAAQSASTSFTTPDNCYYVRFYCVSDYGTTYNNDISFNYPATETAYHAHEQAQTIVLDIGINQWDEQWEVGAMVANTLNAKNLIPVTPNTTYRFVAPSSGVINQYDSTQTQISSTNIGAGATFTTASNCAYVRFRMTTTYGTTYNHDISINSPASITGYLPYTGRGPVYASTITALGGGRYAIQPTHEIYTVTGAEAEWADGAAPDVQLNANVLAGRITGGVRIVGSCSMTPTNSSGNLDTSVIRANSSTGYFLICKGVIGATTWGQSFADLAAWKSWLATMYANGTPLQVCYELAEASRPDPIIVSASDLQTLLGSNTVWLSTGSITDLKYLSDGLVSAHELAPSAFTGEVFTTAVKTLSAANWVNGEQTVSIEATTNNLVIISPDPASAVDYANAGVLCASQGNGSLTFSCSSLPSTDLTVNIAIF